MLIRQLFISYRLQQTEDNVIKNVNIALGFLVAFYAPVIAGEYYIVHGQDRLRRSTLLPRGACQKKTDHPRTKAARPCGGYLGDGINDAPPLPFGRCWYFRRQRCGRGEIGGGHDPPGARPEGRRCRVKAGDVDPGIRKPLDTSGADALFDREI